MKKLFVFLLTLISLMLCGQSEIEKKIENLLIDVPIDGPGIAIGIYKDGQIHSTFTKGLADVGNQIPITKQTNFNIASISKQFTAACIMHLHQNNNLDLSDHISKYIPGFQGSLRDVSIQQLLNHTSGIRDYMSLLMLKQSPQIDFFNSFIGQNEHLYELLLAQKELEFESGSEHRYSNTNYWILGEIVKVVSGESLGGYARINLFEPLQMNNTSFQENSGRIVNHRAVGHVCECPDCEIFEYTHRSSTVGDGGLLTNIEDLLLWENEYYNHEVLNASSWAKMTTKGVLDNGDEISYAAGLIIEEYKGYDIIQHSGQEPGFVTMLLKIPALEFSIAVLANYTWVDQVALAYQIADEFLPHSDGPAMKNPEFQIPEVPKNLVELSTDQLERFCGTYLYQETGEIRSITLKNDTLFYIRDNGPSSILLPLSASQLTYSDRPGITMDFTFMQDVTQILWRHPMGEMTARTFEPIILQDQEIPDYEGEYLSEELGIVIRISSEGQQLSMNVSGHNMPINPVSQSEFLGMGGFKVKFQRDKQDTIITFVLDAPRAGNIHFQKIGQDVN